MHAVDEEIVNSVHAGNWAGCAWPSPVYVTTGENTSHPISDTSDSVMAFNLETWEANWVFQTVENDMWSLACTADGPNYIILDNTNLVDFDFGGPAILVDGGDRELLIAGQKSGDLRAIDLDMGEQLFQFDTVKDFETVNGVEGYGGSIGSHSIAAGSGMVFVGSGYGSFSQVAGNVLPAFKLSE